MVSNDWAWRDSAKLNDRKASGWRCVLSKTRSLTTEKEGPVFFVNGRLDVQCHIPQASRSGWPQTAWLNCLLPLPMKCLDDVTC